MNCNAIAKLHKRITVMNDMKIGIKHCSQIHFGLFPLSQHFEKSNSHIANILVLTPE